jgi:hypothetical protein
MSCLPNYIDCEIFGPIIVTVINLKTSAFQTAIIIVSPTANRVIFSDAGAPLD